MNEHLNIKHMNKKTDRKKWLVLGAVGTALLLIPRRSSRQVAYISESLHTKNMYAKDKEENVDDNAI